MTSVRGFLESVRSDVLPPSLAQHVLFADKEVGAQIPGLTLLCVMKGDCLFSHTNINFFSIQFKTLLQTHSDIMYISVLQRQLYQCHNWKHVVLNLMFDRTRMVYF